MKDALEDFHTIDGASLYSIVFDQDYEKNRFWYNIDNCEVGGKFNIWMCPTKWPVKRWSHVFRDYASKKIYWREKFTSYLFRRGRRAEKALEKARYYYA